MLIRILDVFLAAVGLVFFLPFMLLIFFVGLRENGSPIFVQWRLGRFEKPFMIFKFRTMKIQTPNTASHLVNSDSITSIGFVLRRYKLDELPQLVNVLLGDMSLVGPRPNLPNQHDLIRARRQKNIFDVRPGLTGLATIKNIDMSDPILLATTDLQMIQTLNLLNYFKYIFLTIFGHGRGDAVEKK